MSHPQPADQPSLPPDSIATPVCSNHAQTAIAIRHTDASNLPATGEPAPDSAILCQSVSAERIRSLMGLEVVPSSFSESDLEALEGIERITILADFDVACSVAYCRFVAALAATSMVKQVIFDIPLSDPETGRFQVESKIEAANYLPRKCDFELVAKAVLLPLIETVHMNNAKQKLIFDLVAELSPVKASGLIKPLAAVLEGTVPAVKKAIQDARRHKFAIAEKGVYDVGGIFVRVKTGECIEIVTPGNPSGPTQLLAGFSAHIDEQLTYLSSDGKVTRVKLIISGESSFCELPKIEIPPKDLYSPTWVPENWGHVGVFVPPLGPAQHAVLRAAIQISSQDCVKTVVYKTAGWHVIDGEPVYLHKSGGISKSGQKNVRVDLPGRMAFVDLPEEATSGRCEAIKAMIAVAPPRIIAPLLAGVFRAALMLYDPEPDSLYMYGKTQTRKTSVLGLMMQFFGKGFSKKRGKANPPGLFTSTINSVRELAHTAGSMIFGLDDAAPQTQARLNDAQLAMIETMGRGHSNRSGKSRLDANMEQREENAPRGLLAITAEAYYGGADSLAARFFRVEFREGDVDCAALSHAQELGDSGKFAATMADFLRWSLENGPYGKPEVVDISTSARAGEMTGGLIWAARNIAKWLVDRGEMTNDDAAAFCKTMRAGIMEAAHLSYVAEYEDPVTQFLGHLRAAINHGNATICDVNRAYTSCEDIRDSSRDSIVAYIDGRNNQAFVVCATAVSVVQEFTSKMLYAAPDVRTMSKRLREGGYIVATTPSRDTPIVRKKFGGVSQGVWVMALDKFIGQVDIDPDASNIENFKNDPIIRTALRIFCHSQENAA